MKFRTRDQVILDKQKKIGNNGWLRKFAFLPVEISSTDSKKSKMIMVWLSFYEEKRIKSAHSDYVFVYTRELGSDYEV